MYQSILVPLDGSPAAEHALPLALTIARRDNAELHLVRVHVTTLPLMVGGELASDNAVDAALVESEKSYLESLTARLGKSSGITVRSAILDGAVADTLQEYASTIKADLTVMTTHGRGAFARFWLGSTADKIMRHSSVPTLLVRPLEAGPIDLSSTVVIKKIVIPLDGSELAESAIGPAARLGQSVGAEFAFVLVLDAVEDIETLARMKIKAPGGWFPEATQAKAEVYLERTADALRSKGSKVETKVIRHGSAAGAILDYAHSHGHPVIALATHGRGGMRRMFMGSVADKIIRGASMPVLIYHPAGES